MSKKDYDELIDSHIKYAGKEIFLKLAKEAPTDEELAEFEIPSRDIDKKIATVISKKVQKKRSRRILKISSRVAASFLVLVIISAITIASSQALRARFFDFFKSSDEVSETIYVNDNEDPNAILPGYVPEGYHFADSQGDDILAVSIFEDSNGNTILISRKKSVDVISYDTEHSEVYETTLKGNRVLVIDHPEMNTIYYFGNTYIYTLTGIVEIEELLKIADSLPD